MATLLSLLHAWLLVQAGAKRQNTNKCKILFCVFLAVMTCLKVSCTFNSYCLSPWTIVAAKMSYQWCILVPKTQHAVLCCCALQLKVESKRQLQYVVHFKAIDSLFRIQCGVFVLNTTLIQYKLILIFLHHKSCEQNMPRAFLPVSNAWARVVNYIRNNPQKMEYIGEKNLKYK